MAVSGATCSFTQDRKTRPAGHDDTGEPHRFGDRKHGSHAPHHDRAMTIRAKLALALGAILLLLIMPVAISYRSLQGVHRATQSLRDREFAASLLLGRIRSSVDDLRRAETALLFVHDAGSRNGVALAGSVRVNLPTQPRDGVFVCRGSSFLRSRANRYYA